MENLNAKTTERTRLRTAWAELLEGIPWDHYVTLTFRQSSGPNFAWRAFRRWIRRLERVAGLPVIWFVGFEDGDLLGRLHLHSLVGNTDALSDETLTESWTAGFSRIERFQPGLGAAHYVTKYVTKDLLDYDLSPNIARAIERHEKQMSLGTLRTPPIRRRKKNAKRS
ncbi:MAG: hypothetical protein IT352_18900 [Gemmatimonadales bacterium]|nr:hypothetical protein [Gemmatimonadales bacterium]